MKTIFPFTLVMLFCISAFGQDQQKLSAIVDEGKLLYRSEMASWYGTDVFLERFKEQRQNIGGYFSYTEKDLTKCIFFTKGDNPVVLATITFDSTYNVGTAKVDSKERKLSSYETDIFVIRKKALEAINSDTLFKVYNNTNFNLIPLVNGNDKKVYVLTGPKVNGVVVFGNDYLLTFSQSNELLSKKQLHKNIIPVNNEEVEEGKVVLATMHSHLPETGDYITSTDICTLMLYEKLAKWKQHIVISENYVSIWDCERNELDVLTKEAWENIFND